MLFYAKNANDYGSVLVSIEREIGNAGLKKKERFRATNMAFMKDRILWYRDNWKLGFHLMFRTKRFGANNKWWEEFDSIFGQSMVRKIMNVILIRPLINNYKCMVFRANACHMMTDDQYRLAFGKSKNDHKCKYIVR